MLVVQNWR